MSFDVKIHGRIGPELRSLARRELTKAIEAFATLRPGAVGDAPHEIRKGLKKLRALLALLRAALGKNRLREEDATLRDVGRALSPLRDAQAMQRTLERLRKRFFTGKPPPLLRTIHTGLSTQERRCAATLGGSKQLPACTDSLRGALASTASWPVDDFGWKELRQAIQRSYRRARQSYQKAHAEPTPRRLHQWRKRTKELWYHLRLLRRVSPPFMEELAHDFEVLSEFLGDGHDLVVLRTTLKRRPKLATHPASLKNFLALLGLRHTELIDAAFDLGSRLLADRPRDFTRQLDARRTTRRARKQQADQIASRIAAVQTSTSQRSKRRE